MEVLGPEHPSEDCKEPDVRGDFHVFYAEGGASYDHRGYDAEICVYCGHWFILAREFVPRTSSMSCGMQDQKHPQLASYEPK